MDGDCSNYYSVSNNWSSDIFFLGINEWKRNDKEMNFRYERTAEVIKPKGLHAEIIKDISGVLWVYS